MEKSIMQRRLLVLAVIAVPVIILIAMLPQSPKHAPNANVAGAPANATANRHPETLEQARTRTRNWIAHIKTMTNEQWAAERIKHPNRKATREEAIANNERILQKLQATTPEQWAASHPGAQQAQPKAQ